MKRDTWYAEKASHFAPMLKLNACPVTSEMLSNRKRLEGALQRMYFDTLPFRIHQCKPKVIEALNRAISSQDMTTYAWIGLEVVY